MEEHNPTQVLGQMNHPVDNCFSLIHNLSSVSLDSWQIKTFNLTSGRLLLLMVVTLLSFSVAPPCNLSYPLHEKFVSWLLIRTEVVPKYPTSNSALLAALKKDMKYYESIGIRSKPFELLRRALNEVLMFISWDVTANFIQFRRREEEREFRGRKCNTWWVMEKTGNSEQGRVITSYGAARW